MSDGCCDDDTKKIPIERKWKRLYIQQRECPFQNTPASLAQSRRLYHKAELFLGYLLWTKITVVSALLLSAVLCTRWKSSIASTANLLLAIVFSCQNLERWLNSSSSQSQNKM
mmetsp:Transcript_6815/g.25441  ORF Transcript_6815/g.25441 Transcript_6815/m.25441 type:complete len:113 (-) Transcript_6815:887-1225(-)